MFLLARLSFVANSPLNMVFTFTLPCLSTASRIRFRAHFQRLLNCRGSMWLEFITAPINILSNAASISRQTRDRSLPLAYSPLAYSPLMCTNVTLIATLHANRTILAIVDCLCPTARRGRLARQSSSSCSMYLSHRCDTNFSMWSISYLFILLAHPLSSDSISSSDNSWSIIFSKSISISSSNTSSLIFAFSIFSNSTSMSSTFLIFSSLLHHLLCSQILFPLLQITCLHSHHSQQSHDGQPYFSHYTYCDRFGNF